MLLPRSAFAAAVLLAVAPASAQVVINEVYYDAPGTDDGQVFIELFGPAGTDISGWRLQSIEGATGNGGTCNPQSFVFPAGAVIPASGIVVVADTTSGGSTTVPSPTYTTTNLDLENGGTALSPSGEAVQLLDASGAYVDAVAYGACDTSGGAASACNGQTWFEGSPARDVFAPLSIERCSAGRDSGNNGVDFTPNVPTPGATDDCCLAIEWVDRGAGNTVSLAAAESVGLDFWSSCSPNQAYLVLGAFTDPTVVPPPAGLPVWDATTPIISTLANIPPFVAWAGVLGANGESVGAAAVDFSGFMGLPPLPAPVPMYIGTIMFGPGGFVHTNHVTVVWE